MWERTIILSDHISTSSIVWSAVSGRTDVVSCAVKWVMDEETGMVCDFGDLKQWFRGVLNSVYDHGAFVLEWHPMIHFLQRHGLKHTVVTYDAHEWKRMVGIIEKGLRATIPAWLTLEGVEIGNPYPKGDWFEQILNFSHRLIGIDKCENIHGHSWLFQALGLWTDKWNKKRIKEALLKSWDKKLVLHENDPLWDEIITYGIDIKTLKQRPTTEVLIAILAKELQDILGHPTPQGKYLLRETPSQAGVFRSE